MKNLTAFLLISVLLFGACKNNSSGTDGADKKDKKETNLSPEAEHDLKMYKQAIDRADASSAIYALNSYLLRDTAKNTNNIGYLDTLTKLYYKVGEYGAAYKTSTEVLKHKPNDTTLLVINVTTANASYQLGAVLNSIKKLADMQPDNLEIKLFMAKSMMENGDIQGAINTLNSIVNNPESMKQEIAFTIFDENGELRQVPLKAKMGALMQLAQLHFQMGDMDSAEKNALAVLKIQQNFRPAAEILLEIRAVRKGAAR